MKNAAPPLRKGSSLFSSSIIAGVAVLTVFLVGLTLRRPPLETFTVTPTEAVEVGSALVGPRVVTVDASPRDRWVFFDFSRGAVVERGEGLDWDLALNRSSLLVNGGDGFPGEGGVVELGDAAFDSVSEAPESGYVGSEAARDSVHPLLSDWYDYSFTSHLLTAKPRVYVLRTADGRYAKLRFLGYYCAGPTPACVTFQYVYQGDGSRSFLPWRAH